MDSEYQTTQNTFPEVKRDSLVKWGDVNRKIIFFLFQPSNSILKNEGCP